MTGESFFRHFANRMQQLIFKPKSNNEIERLFAAAFPGESYSSRESTRLVQKLREVCSSLEGGATEALPPQQPTSGPSSVKAAKADLDFDVYQRRYVALEFLYLGHDYDGLARQDSTPNTIEEYLLNALRKTRLIPAGADCKDIKFSRAGRTDKGVSALGQVAALLLRSVGKVGSPPVEEYEEIDYASVLNRVLPEDIRVLGWTTVPDDFSARFSATHREYKYLIVNNGGLDIDKMREAAKYLEGPHDFRNFCKPDVVAVRTFERNILEVRVEPITGGLWGDTQLIQFYVRGTAFLWHQVRCMVAVLLMVGRGEELPSIVSELLDLSKTPQKPTYVMASDEPLILAACGYPDLVFRRPAANYENVQRSLEQRFNSHLIRAGLVKTILEKLATDEVVEAPMQRKRKLNGHIPLLSRPKEPTIEERRVAKGLPAEVVLEQPVKSLLNQALESA